MAIYGPGKDAMTIVAAVQVPVPMYGIMPRLLPHLFPDLERTLRETEFTSVRVPEGHQTFQIPLPIREVGHNFHAASDGQLGWYYENAQGMEDLRRHGMDEETLAGC